MRKKENTIIKISNILLEDRILPRGKFLPPKLAKIKGWHYVAKL